jgi:[acyl-carrier-protein] S-malonyltransferase
MRGNRLLAVVCPGQGSQHPGMLISWIKSDVGRDIINMASNCSSLDLNYFGTSASKEEISDTSIAQVLITACSLISAELLQITKFSANEIILAGHSVGEITAFHLSGIFSIQDALAFVSARGKYMAKSAKENPNTGMVAILGGQLDEIINKLEMMNLTPANINSQNQIVAAGRNEDLLKLIGNPPRNTKLIKLDVAAAFHTFFMDSARRNFADSIKNHDISNPKYKLITNNQGNLVVNKNVAINELIAQISSPVRWDLCQKTLLSAKVSGILELAPGGTLVGIAKREMPGIEGFAIKSLDDIQEAIVFMKRHTSDT